MAEPSFLDKVRAHAARQGASAAVDWSLAAMILARSEPAAFLKGLKAVGKLYGKSVVKATLVAIVETALED